MAYRDVVLADSPIDYYEMNTSTGTDSGSGGRTLTLAGGVTTGATGKVGNCWQFDGVNDSASMASWYNPSPNFTFEAWVKAPSAQGMTGDYHTIVRRDGTDIILLRVRGSNITGNVNAGQLEAYVDGITLTSGSSYRVDDGNWHHVALTVAGSACKLYVDGVERATATAGQTTWSMGTGAAYIGSAGGSSEYFKGYMDEVAVYNTALSATRIAAHYSAATPTYVDVPTVTASTQAYDVQAGQPVNVTVDVSAVTASALANEVAVGKSVNIAVTGDQKFIDQTSVGSYAENPFILSGSNGPDAAALNFVLPSDFSDAGLFGASLSLTASSGNTAETLTVYAITSPWTEGTNTVPTLSTSSLTWTWPTGTGTRTLDVSPLVTKSDFYGFWIVGSAARFYSREDVTATNCPSMKLTYAVIPQSATVDADTPTASLAALDVDVKTDAVNAVLSASINVVAPEATAEASTSPDAIVDVPTSSVATAANDVSVSTPVEVVLSAVTLAAQAIDATVALSSNAVIELDTPRILLTHIQPTDVNGEPIESTEEEDPFFNSTMLLQPNIWYRYNDATAPPVPRVYGDNTDLANYAGRIVGNVTVGLNTGPNGRKHYHFNGAGRVEQFEATIGTTGGESTAPVSTLEFAIRTTKKNQFVMRMDDTNHAPASSRYRVRDLYLKDGKVQYKVWADTPSANSDFVALDFVGTTDIADGNWHHIVMTNDPGPDDIVDGALEGFNIYIDGELEYHRRRNLALSYPDYVGGRVGYPGLFSPMYADLPPADWFVGDIAEVVSFRRALTQDQIYRQNDSLFGYDPVYLEPARANMTAYEAVVRSNTKRVLCINLGARQGTISQKIDGVEVTLGFGGLAYPGSSLTNGVKKGDYQFFTADAYFSPEDAPGPVGNQWYEPRYDVNRMLDLDKDLNMEDYDIINVVGYPTTGTDWEDLDRKFSDWSLFGGPSARKQLENLLQQVRDFAINGGGLYITDPSTAAAVGVINDFDVISTLQSRRSSTFDYGNSGGDFDRRAAEIDPWQGGGSKGSATPPRTPPYQLNPNTDYARRAYFYRDMHENGWQTVRTLVDGLTDIPGRIITDYIEYYPYLDNGSQAAEKTVQRDEGLNVGDTFRIMGTRGAGRGDQFELEGIGAGPTMRVHGQIAAPVSAVKAGTVVTTFAQNYWAKVGNDDVLSPNPYATYAVAVVVRPGDVLNGQVVQGRIFMDFSEGFVDLAPEMHTVRVDQVPPNSQISNPLYHETEESRQWTYSSYRGAWGDSINTGTPTQTTTIDERGNVVITYSNGNSGVIGLKYTPRWPVINEAAPTMHYRGLKWVSGGQDADGNATVGVESATVNASAKDVTVTAQKSSDQTVQTARVITQSFSDLDTLNPDAEVLATTAQVSAKAVPFSEVIEVETARVATRANDDLDGILATADLVVLRLPTPYAILTLEER